ncbi:CLUMA_CG006249, isoform A [Clunio marinus]|uniref:CLUMA_CG006249, isoform A n=1 Tax=Clunio marinus TaxID=568069 RepID=A0A1J1HXG6_9DIPT|nr:CLUMA_CG006249, isoform A [Clunio marinus]
MTTEESNTFLIGNKNDIKPNIVSKNMAVTLSATDAEKQNIKNERGKAFRQVVAAFIANIGPVNTGLIFGFSAVVIPQLQSKNSSIPIDESQASWIASLSSLSTPFGCILGGYLMDNIGRKKTLIFTEIPMIIGWMFIFTSHLEFVRNIFGASGVKMIYTGRLLTGLGSGMVGAPARIYTSEVTQPHLRGMLTALSSVGLSFGVLFQYSMGALLSWQTLSLVSSVVPLIALIGMLLVPETPNYLVSHQQPQKAAQSLAKLRGSSYNVEREIHQLEEFAKKINSKNKTSAKEILQSLLAPSCLKPFGILFIYFMLYQFSGVNTITFYAVEIFQDSGTNLDKYTCTVILGALRFTFTILACILLRRSGRRPLSFISGFGCGITMIGLGIYMRYKAIWDAQNIAPVHTWIPVACIFIFMITCTLGFLVVPWVMIGELYPMKIRGIVGGMTTCAAHCFVFIVVKTYPFMTHLIERHGVFILYGCISFVGGIFFYFYLPETKGRTLQEIEDYFSGRIATLKVNKNYSTTPVDIYEKGILLPNENNNRLQEKNLK